MPVRKLIAFERALNSITENFFFGVLNSKFTDTIRQGLKFDVIFISNGVNTDIWLL